MGGGVPFTWLFGPPNVPMSMSLYWWCFGLWSCNGLSCAAMPTGIARAANSVITTTDDHFLGVILPPFHLRLVGKKAVPVQRLSAVLSFIRRHINIRCCVGAPGRTRICAGRLSRPHPSPPSRTELRCGFEVLPKFWQTSGKVRHPPQSGWLDELGRLKGGRSNG